MGGISDHGLRSGLGGLRREWPGGDAAADYGAASEAKVTNSPGKFLQKTKRQRTTTKAQLRHITIAEEGVVGRTGVVAAPAPGLALRAGEATASGDWPGWTMCAHVTPGVTSTAPGFGSSRLGRYLRSSVVASELAMTLGRISLAPRQHRQLHDSSADQEERKQQPAASNNPRRRRTTASSPPRTRPRHAEPVPLELDLDLEPEPELDSRAHQCRISSTQTSSNHGRPSEYPTRHQSV